MKVRLFLWLPLVFFFLITCGCDSESHRLKTGDPAPDFTLTDLDGNSVRLAELRGQVVALRFWADWCPYCKDEMKALEPVHQRLQHRDLRLLAVNVGQDRETAERFVHRLELSYPALLDPESAVARRYGVIGLPTTVFIDRGGRVRGKILGESDALTFERMVEDLLKEPPGRTEQ